MSSMMIAREDIYGPDEAQDQAEQERRRHEEDVRQVDPEAVVSIVTERLRDDDMSELRAFVALVRRVPYEDATRAVMAYPDEHRLGQQIAHFVAEAFDQLATQGMVGRR